MTLAALLLALTAAEPASLSWLSGQWRETKGDAVVDEIWDCPSGGILLGRSRTLRAGRVTTFEQMRITPGENGPVFTASPNGQVGASFTVLAAGPDRVVFTSPTNDFPKAVSYARSGDVVVAAIYADAEAKSPAQSWRYERVASLKCD